MMSNLDRTIIMKAMAYDLLCLIDDAGAAGDKATFTPEEIEKLITSYIASEEQN